MLNAQHGGDEKRSTHATGTATHEAMATAAKMFRLVVWTKKGLKVEVLLSVIP